MKLGELGSEHRYQRVTYTSPLVVITGTLDYFQTLENGGPRKRVLTIGGWVSPPLGLDDELELHDGEAAGIFEQPA